MGFLVRQHAWKDDSWFYPDSRAVQDALVTREGEQRVYMVTERNEEYGTKLWPHLVRYIVDMVAWEEEAINSWGKSTSTCGRYVSPTTAEMERYWALSNAARNNQLSFSQHFKIAPTTQIPNVFLGEQGLELAMARWSLVPFWWKQPKMPPFTFNARIEEAASKPIWRRVVKTSRCLVAAITWYERKEVEVPDPVTSEIKKAKRPYFIHLPGRHVFPFAGLMSRWKAAESDAAILTASIITRAAEGPAAELHTPMPLILPQEAEAAWMDAKQTDG